VFCCASQSFRVSSVQYESCIVLYESCIVWYESCIVWYESCIVLYVSYTVWYESCIVLYESCIILYESYIALYESCIVLHESCAVRVVYCTVRAYTVLHESCTVRVVYCTSRVLYESCTVLSEPTVLPTRLGVRSARSGARNVTIYLLRTYSMVMLHIERLSGDVLLGTLMQGHLHLRKKTSTACCARILENPECFYMQQLAREMKFSEVHEIVVLFLSIRPRFGHRPVLTLAAPPIPVNGVDSVQNNALSSVALFFACSFLYRPPRVRV